MLRRCLIVWIAASPLLHAETPPISSAHQEYYEGRLERSAETCERILAETPSDQDAVLGAALALEGLGKAKEARRFWDVALALNPSPSVLLGSGWNFAAQGKTSAALKEFARVPSDDPLYWQARFGQGYALFSSGDYPKAEIALTETLALHKNLACAQYLLGRMAGQRKKWDKALEHYQAALNVDHTMAEVFLPMARIHKKQGKVDDAWKTYQQVLNMDKDQAEAKKSEAELRPFLSRTPKQLLSQKKITTPPAVETAGAPSKLSMRVGLGVDSSGKPLDIQEVSLQCGSPFKIIEASFGLEVSGKALTFWKVRYSPTVNLLEVVNPSGVVEFSTRNPVRFVPSVSTSTFVIEDLEYAKGFAWSGQADHAYRSELELSVHSGGLTIVNVLPVEDYLYSVLPSEMPSWWPKEALKAQAVLARTEAVTRAKAHQHGRDGYDVCSSQHCQVYSGTEKEDAAARAAVEETRNKILFFQGKPARGLYSSNCGGHTQSASELDGWGDSSTLRGRLDAGASVRTPESAFQLWQWLTTEPMVYCRASLHSPPAQARWVRVLEESEIRARVNRRYPVGVIRNIIARKRSLSGHVNSLEIIGNKGSVTLTKEHEIRNALIPGNLRSTLFTVFTEQGSLGAKRFILWGGGWGHAVGLCQAGAAGQAGEGKTAENILQFYFNGVTVGDIP